MAATLAAWALLFHILAMPLAAMPHTDGGVSAAFTVLCSGQSLAQPDGSGSSGKAAPSQTCVLCGSAHAALDLPHTVRFATPRGVIETLAFAPRERQPIHVPPHTEARPRAPPAFA